LLVRYSRAKPILICRITRVVVAFNKKCHFGIIEFDLEAAAVFIEIWLGKIFACLKREDSVDGCQAEPFKGGCAV